MKHIVKFGSTATNASETVSATAGSSITQDYSEFSKMDVVLIVTITGTSPTVTYVVEELFGGNWVETARSKAITATGNYTLVQGITPPDQTSVLNHGAFWALGSGAEKRVKTVVTGTQIALSSDIYFAFYK